jgi:hypothetical protein
MLREEELIHFVANTLTTDLLELACLTGNGEACLRFERKIKLGRETDRTQETERIFVEALVRLVTNGA